MATQTIVPTLHHLTSSHSHRILVAFEELSEAHGFQYKLKVHERAEERQKGSLKNVFPLGKSPIVTVEENGEPSKKIYQLPKYPGIITESTLILRWLKDNFSQGIWDTENELDKIQEEFFLEFHNSTLLMKVNFAVIFETVPKHLPIGLRSLVGAMTTPVVNYWKTDIDPIIGIMEEHLTEERPWFSGKKMGLADLNMLFGLDAAYQRKLFDYGKYPKVIAWRETMVARSSWKRALEKGGFYNLVTYEEKK
jgi:glutathione S-transferase